MKAAAQWICDYSIPMNDRTCGEAACRKADRDTATLARWIAQERPREVHVRTLQREVRLPGLKDAADIHAAGANLIEAGWLMSTVGKTGFQHRPRAVDAINPRLCATCYDPFSEGFYRDTVGFATRKLPLSRPLGCHDLGRC
jgi:hypothetical protein